MGSTGTGTASFAATDAPADDLTEVQVTFDRIDLQPQEGERQSFTLEPPRTIDLLSLTGEASEPILEDTTVPAGQYEFIRLFVIGGQSPAGGGEGSFVTEDGGGDFDLFIPGQQNRPPQSQGQRRFLQLSSGFTVPAGGNVDFTIDFELNKALTKVGNAQGTHYLLRPSLRLINNVEVDSITGEIGSELTLLPSCETVEEGNAVYLYAGHDAAPGDVNLTDAEDSENDDPQPDHDSDDSDGDTAEVNPITVASATDENSDGTLEYTIGFVAAGDYTVAFTCEAERDTSENDEDIAFQQPQNVTVDADNDPEVVNFTALPGS